MDEASQLPNNLPDAIRFLANSADADIYVLSGEISRAMADQVIDAISSSKDKENAYLLLTTYGGSADAAYLIANTFKKFYEKFTLVVFGYCKSAGTLIALGADEIVMALHAELGPLDVQILKENELGSQSSGLDIFKTLDIINEKAFEIFEHTMLSVKARSGGLITTKMASDLAVTMATQLLAPVMAQVDPTKLGEMQRAIDIARHYGTRLGASVPTINKLINEYPSHGFVIDINEAKELFPKVRPANEVETILEKLLGVALTEQFGIDCIRKPHGSGVLLPLHESLKQIAENNKDETMIEKTTSDDNLEQDTVKVKSNAVKRSGKDASSEAQA
ncbi:SDH family Clp fold serine proteinase [Deinococcus petrolearius]|uniref:ATP-dependent Clp protease proteolytic subunit n=1 Tax=Deinococcus petrolearius TaxID=1751295 RepID=A0ABW1DJA3_9DEIO